MVVKVTNTTMVNVTSEQFATQSNITDFIPDRNSDLIGASGSIINFTDLSVPTPGAWLWDFGDGTTSALQNPVHTYTQAGLFSVSLTPLNGNWIPLVMHDLIELHTSTFLHDVGAGVASLTVTFTDTSAATSWLWDFGDGNTSTLQNPVHTYTRAGEYLVKLQRPYMHGSYSDIGDIVAVFGTTD